MGALPQARCRHRTEVRQQGGGTGLVLFVGGQQTGCGIAVTVSSGLCQLQGLFHLRGAGFVLCGGKHRANVPVEQFAVQRGRLFVHPLCGAVAGALLRRDRSHCKADAAAADGGQHTCQRIRRKQEQHPLRRLFHHLQQGVCGFLVHLFHMVEQHGTALGRKAGVEDLAAHSLDLTDQIFSACAHTGNADRFTHDAGLHMAAVAVAGLTHSTAAFAPQKGLSGRSACRVKIICRNAAGCKTGSKALFTHQQHAVGQAAGCQHQLHAAFQFCIALHAVQHHGVSPYLLFLRFHCSRRTHARTER